MCVDMKAVVNQSNTLTFVPSKWITVWFSGMRFAPGKLWAIVMGGLSDSGTEVRMPHCELCRKNPDSQKYFHAGEKLPHQNAINSETFLREVSSSECNQRLALLVECLSFQVEHPAAARKCSTHSPLRSAKY